MVWLAIGAGLLLLGLWLLRLFADAEPQTIRKAGAWILGTLGMLLLALLLASGRAAQAVWTLALFGPLVWRLVQGWRAARRFGRGSPGMAGGGGESAVETATLAMRLDHSTGQMSGRVRRTRFAGRELAELALPEVLELLEDCRRADPESVPLLEAWLDRTEPDWRQARPAGHAAAGPMTREEALEVLGLREGASAEEIRQAHRRLMRAAHPDQGGSDWLAARINQARDVLLG
ncbi:MAG: hypothetical protein QJR07_04450 [Acetobacteraceae bacterium]|nr:hypothetical protein [Acetobacteraceae bacterium]